ncbi:hypothetical protein E2C01_090770 [Portunus trituberculatus]|uniref:Uncharacterized protein n=1 Tax=Portunus trituberculatus TaxID=210409 RepID=A0A5B7JM85_PORTR|nr:hypothetical protein [Portunus trituberculatus]
MGWRSSPRHQTRPGTSRPAAAAATTATATAAATDRQTPGRW